MPRKKLVESKEIRPPDHLPLKCWHFYFVRPTTVDQTKWLCRCECGVSMEVKLTELESGEIRSCGCRGHGPQRLHRSCHRRVNLTPREAIEKRRVQRKNALARRVARGISRLDRLTRKPPETPPESST